uniref:U1 small nuclear ribonucleoprotein C n=1 Tax=Globisporangium ultimum (strain ATCC 200006 / CBS 805.95 / DAOM BR144) TaxID=431595 RepID=K3WTM9_GLOUD
MPRYYCDYCDTYLTHDSQAGRKQHNRGWKHRENVKLYYEQFLAGQGGIMTPGEWLRAAPAAGSLPPRPMGGGMPGGMYPPRGPPPRGMMPPGGPGMMRPPPFHGPPRGPPMGGPMGHMGGRGMMPPPRPSIYGPQ